MNSFLTTIQMNNFYRKSAFSQGIVARLLALATFLIGTGLQAQTFPTPTGFTLPAGKTITITYEVDVNSNACPTGGLAPTSITNQSNVSGSNFATVNTSSTVTPFGALTLGNLVYKDNNKNGIFDTGDAGIDGVSVRLFVDDGDDVLDAGDGAALATATTSGGGFYSFSVCPGNYIVEVAATNFNVGGPLYDNGLMAALVSSPVGGAADPNLNTNDDDDGDPVSGFGVASRAITLTYDDEPINDEDTDANTNLSLDFGFKTPTNVTINDVTISEGTGGGPTTFTFTVTRSDIEGTFDLIANTTAGTATSGSDFAPLSNVTVPFTVNISNTATVTVEVPHDNIVEANETFTVVLSGAPSGVIITDNTGLGTINNDDQATLSINNVSNTEGDAGSQIYNFTVTSDKAVDVPFTVNAGTVNGTATTGDNDYAASSATLNFLGNVNELQTFSVTVNGDMKVEPTETFMVQLNTVFASGRNVVISGSSGTGTGTITNDDNATISINDVSLAEGNAGTTNFVFNVTLNKVVSTDVTVDFATAIGSAGAGDFNANSGILTFPANGAGQTQTITVQVIGEVMGEANENFFVNLGNVQGSPSVSILDAQGLGTILDDDLAFSINDVAFAEGNAGTTNLTFTVTRTSTATAETIQYATADNTATTADNDYVNAAGTLNFAIGDDTETITVVVNGDNKVELNETFFVNLSNASNGSISDGQGIGTINNDDNATLTLTGGIAQNEGNAGSTVYTFTATLSAPVQGGFQAAYTTGAGTAISGTDYTDNDGTLTFAGTAGETQSWSVNVSGDNTVEVDETFQGALGSLSMSSAVQLAAITPGGSPQTATISNDDAAVVAIAANVSQSEATTPQTFSVTLSSPVDVPVTVQFSTADATATTGDADYTAVTNQTVTFPTGTTTVQSVPVSITNDTKVEADEVFNVSIGTLAASGRNVTLGTSSRTGTIQNDDVATVTLSAAASPLSLSEGNTGTTNFVFTVTLNNAVQGGFTLPYTTSGGSALTPEDYIDNDGTLTFAGTAGEVQTITVQANGDLKVEANEDFFVTLGAITGAPTGVSLTGTPKQGLIVNDELDWGDAPDTYNTLSANSGARHNTSIAFHLGATVDGDLDGQPGVNADGDDADAEGDDDDGVTLPASLITGTTANVTVNASGAGFLNAWVDFNNNGTWDVSEQIFTNTAVITGNNALSFAVPAGATPSTTFARFRYTTASIPSPVFTGLQTTGEVEDYQVTILNNQYSISSPTVTEGSAPNTVNLTYTISRTTTTGGGSVDYSAPAGTATSGSDYVALSGGTINFLANGNPSETVTVVVNGDNIVEDNETIIITLSNPVNGAISSGTGTGTITNDDAATLTLTGGIAKNEGSAGNTAYTFTTTLSAPVQGGFQVAYSTGAGTATAGTDYTDNDGALTFAGTAGETQFWTVNVSGDNTVELDETFQGALGSLSMSSVVQLTAITPGGSPQTATITNDDAATVSIAANVSQSEATTPQTFSVTLSSPVDVPVTVQFSTADGTATTGDADYTAVTNQTVTFNAGTTTAQSVPVSITNDTKVETDEVFNVNIGTLTASGRTVSLGTAAATGTLQNDDNATVTLSMVSAASQNEGNTGTTAFTFRATLNNPVPGGFTLAYTTNDGTAAAGTDYTDNDNSLTFSGTAGEFHDIIVNALGELVIENDETFTVSLGAVTALTPVQSAAVSTAGSPQTATIVNDELDWGDAPNPTYPTLSANNGARHTLTPTGLRLGASVDADLDGQPTATASGDGADEDGVTLPSVLVLNNTATLTVNASSTGQLDAWVDFNRDGDWDDAGEKLVFTPSANLTAGNNTLTFNVPAGASVGISFARFRVSTAGGLSPTGLAAEGEVEDYPINIVNTQFSIDDVSITEGNSGTKNLTFTVSRTVNANACSVDYALSGGTATSGTDYQAFSNGTLNFTAGGPLFQTLTVVINGDNTVELDETIVMSLSNPVNASILDGSGTGTIQNDDAAIITITNPTITEGSSGTSILSFNLTLSQPSDANVIVNYTTLDGTATTADNDYQPTSGTLTFAPGETAKTLNVSVNGDCNVEANEILLLRLSSLNANARAVTFSGGGATLDATGTILNTPRPTATISGTASLCQGAPEGVVTFTGSGGTAPYTFTYSVNGGGSQSVTTVSGNSVTVSQSTNSGDIFTYNLLIVSDVHCSQNQTGTAVITVFGKPTITLSVNGETFNEGNSATLCDTDADPTNALLFNLTTSCAAGSLVWRTQSGDGNWSTWSGTVPATQPSDNVAYRYQAACDAGCPSTFTGIITLTINYRASTPQNVSLVVDGTTVAAGESKTVCDLVGNALVFSAGCAAGEILLYSVDGADFSSSVPSQLVDGNFHNYRVRCRKANGTPSCVETESAPVSLRISPIPAAPVVSISPQSNCGTPTAFIGTTSCGALVTIWFDAATNLALPSLPAMTPNTTTSYYARCQNEAGCLSEKSNTVTFTITPVNEPPVVSASADIVCTGTSVTISANCPAGATAFWNTGVTTNSFQVAFNNVTQQSYWAKCIFANGCQSSESVHKTILWKAFELTFINIGQSQSAIKPANDRNLWTSQFITPDAGPMLENSTQANPTVYHSENVNKTAPRFWTIQVQTCALGTDGSVTYDMLASPEAGIVRSYNTHENNAPYLMYANRDGFTELYAQNHPAYGFFADNGSGGNTYDEGLPKGLYKLGVRYWDQKGQGSIYPSTRQPAGNVLAYQEYWFRIQSRDGIGTGAAKVGSPFTVNNLQLGENPLAQVVPNPVSNTLRLKVSEAKGQSVNVSMSDAAGRTLLQRSFVPKTNQHQEEFEVSQLANGIYFMQISTAQKQTTIKVIKVQ